MSIKTKLVWKSRQRRIAKKILESLCIDYPNAFFPPDSSHTKPLKVGIFWNLYRERKDIGGRVLGIILDEYTSKDRYLRALVSQPHRVDLQGNPSGDVTDDHRQFAIDTLIKRQQKNLANKAA